LKLLPIGSSTFGSMIRPHSDDEFVLLRVTVVEKLSDQQHLAEDELVIFGLKYLHQDVGVKK
jgi:hypothetical protein